MRYLVVGGSRGLGAALVEGLPRGGDEIVVVSRTEPRVNVDGDVWFSPTG